MPFSFHCPYCGFKAKLGFHLDDHIKKKHQDKIRGYNKKNNNVSNKVKIDKFKSEKVERTLFFKECTCKGDNPNCFKCEGRGYIKTKHENEQLKEPLQLIKPVNWFAADKDFKERISRRKKIVKSLHKKSKKKKR